MAGEDGDSRLARRLGVADAVLIGLASMIRAGVFSAGAGVLALGAVVWLVRDAARSR